MAPCAALAFLHPGPLQRLHAPVSLPFAGSWGLSNRNCAPALRLHSTSVVPARSVVSQVASSEGPNLKQQKQGSGKKVTSRNGAKNGPVLLRRTGFNSPVVLSEPMQDFVGEEMATRSKLLSVLRRYIRENDLYVGDKRQSFKCDATLERLFGVRGTQPLPQLARFLMPHVRSPEGLGDEYERRAREMYEEYLRERGAVESTSAARKDRRGMNSREIQKEMREKGLGMFKDVELDPCLRGICGGKSRMSRPQVLKTVWQYIKGNGLQNPENGRMIRVTNALREGLKITDREEIDCFEVTKYVCMLLTPLKEP